MKHQYETFEEHIAAVESWLSGEQDRRASDLLKKRGFNVKKQRSLSDAQLPEALRELIEVLAEEKIYLDCTDHFSDRELYKRITAEVLPFRFAVGGDEFGLYDFSDVYDDETRENFLAYYADDEERKMAEEMDDEPVPARKARPFDRDRTLPRPANWSDYYV